MAYQTPPGRLAEVNQIDEPVTLSGQRGSTSWRSSIQPPPQLWVSKGDIQPHILSKPHQEHSRVIQVDMDLSQSPVGPSFRSISDTEPTTNTQPLNRLIRKSSQTHLKGSILLPPHPRCWSLLRSHWLVKYPKLLRN
jgi:hypothetical protein